MKIKNGISLIHDSLIHTTTLSLTTQDPFVVVHMCLVFKKKSNNRVQNELKFRKYCKWSLGNKYKKKKAHNTLFYQMNLVIMQVSLEK